MKQDLIKIDKLCEISRAERSEARIMLNIFDISDTVAYLLTLELGVWGPLLAIGGRRLLEPRGANCLNTALCLSYGLAWVPFWSELSGQSAFDSATGVGLDWVRLH